MKKITSASLLAFLAIMSILFTACKKSHPAPANAKNAIAYIYKTSNNDALAFKALMELNNCTVQLIEIADAASLDYSKYKLIVADHNTNSVGLSNWTDAHVNTLKASGKPMLLLGMGGLLYAKKIGNIANWINSGQFNETAIYVKDKTSNLYKKPKVITITAAQTIVLYTVPALGAGQYLPMGTLPGVTLMGSLAGQQNYYPLTYEQNRYTVLGFDKGVNSMTADGKDFMVNLVYFSGNLSF